MGSRPLMVPAIAAATILIVAAATSVASALTPTVPYTDNAECIECHRDAGIAVSKVDFEADPPVDRAVVCRRCHWEPAAQHPYHLAAWNCGACHPFTGSVNPAAVPKVNTANGYFNTAASAVIDAQNIHLIHSSARWPATFTKNGRRCASCHTAAACTACHLGSIDPRHEDHTWDTGSGDYTPGMGPAATTFGMGTTVGNEYELNLGTGLPCSNPICHETASGAGAMIVAEDTSSSISFSADPAWVRSSQTGYSGSTFKASNGSGAWAEYTFTGQMITLVTDRSPLRGYVRVRLDGAEVLYASLYSPTVQKQVVAYTSPLLSAGSHTIRIEVPRVKEAAARDYYVVLDAFRVYPRVTMTRTTCVTCHGPDTFTGPPVDRSGDHGAPEAIHTPGGSGYCQQAGCHTGYVNIASAHAARGDSCLACHENPAITDVGHDPWKFSAGVTRECETCHNLTTASLGSKTGNPFDYRTVHPSRGGVPCYLCHPYEASMDRSGASRMSSYHHVMGTAGTAGDIAPNDGAYPTSKDDVYCVSCHTDHNYFNDEMGANLRQNINDPSGASRATSDFIAGGNPGAPGVCVSCHDTERVKDTANQKASVAPSTRTPAIGAVDYETSAHDYEYVTAFGPSTSPFWVNCGKCHNDDTTKLWQYMPDNSLRFALHWSSESKVLGWLSIAPQTDPAEERFCYQCHSEASDSHGAKFVAGSVEEDWYAAMPMTLKSVKVHDSLAKAYGHKPDSYSGEHAASPTDETQAYLSANKHVECADCHDPHAAGSGTHTTGTNLVSPVIKGVPGLSVTLPATPWTVPTVYTPVESSTYEYQICLRCHSGANTALTTWDDAAGDTWTDAALEFNTANKSFHPVFGALNSPGSGSENLAAVDVGGGFTPGSTMYCSDCHGDDAYSATSAGPHGSAKDHLLVGPNSNWPSGSSEPTFGQYAIGLTAGQMQGLFCLNCHPNLNSTGAESNYVHKIGSHRTAWTSGSYSTRGMCTNCHLLVPHGGKVSRLLYTPGAPARYRGPGYRAGSITRYAKPHGSAYLPGRTDGNCDGGCVVGHTIATTTIDPMWYEQW